jgi:hypothetical protein
MKLFKITEKDIQLLLNHIGEFPIRYEGLIKGIMDIIKSLEEIIEPNPEIKD